MKRLLGLLLLFTAMSHLPDANAKGHNLSVCETLLSRPYIVPEDVVQLANYSKKAGLFTAVMAPNPASLPYTVAKGYVAKTSELNRCKSAKSGRIAGLVHCPPELFRDQADWEHNRDVLAEMGYTILGPDQDYLVKRNSDGKLFYSDYDLLGVYNGRSGKAAYTEDMRVELNETLGRRLFRHGPLDDFWDMDAIEIKYPVLVFTPKGKVLVVESERQLKSLYAQYRIAWKRAERKNSI